MMFICTMALSGKGTAWYFEEGQHEIVHDSGKLKLEAVYLFHAFNLVSDHRYVYMVGTFFFLL